METKLNDCNCLYPVVIASPTLLHDALRSTHIVIDGHSRRISSSDRFELLKNCQKATTILKIPFLQSITEDFVNSHSVGQVRTAYENQTIFIENSFLNNVESGEVFPLYQLVPCGHCDVCLNAKLQSLIQRSQFAMEEAKKPAAFVTLTYNRHHIPNDFCVRKRHIELFKKRFKKNCASLYAKISVKTIEDKSLVPDMKIRSRRKLVSSDNAKNIKFICTSEYGKKGRPHYHMLIFGIPRLSIYDEEHDYLVRKLLQYCWRVPERDIHTSLYVDFDSYRFRYPRAVFNKGETPRADEIDPLSYGFVNYKEVSTSKCAKYVLKYVYKQRAGKDFVPDKPSFISVSQSLGLQFVKQYCKGIEDSDGKFRYMSHFDYSLKEVNLTSYYLRKVFPSFSKLVPCSFRRDYLDCEYYGRILLQDKLVPLAVRHSVFACLSCVRDLCSPLVLYDDFNIVSPSLSSPSLLRVVKGDLEGAATVEVQDMVPRFLQHFYSSYSRIISESQSINWKYIFDQVYKRDKLLNKFECRSRSKLVDIGRKFSKDMKEAFSKQVLA